jgi:hypothetical protein
MDGVIDNQTWLEERVDAAVLRIFQRLPSPTTGRVNGY